jgi:hypothetical protein
MKSMRISNRMISTGTMIAMLLAAPAMAQTAATTNNGTGLAPAGPAGNSGIAGISLGTIAAIGAVAAIAAVAVAVSSGGGGNAPVTTSTAVTSTSP